jgi:hypothetical protein
MFMKSVLTALAMLLRPSSFTFNAFQGNDSDMGHFMEIKTGCLSGRISVLNSGATDDGTGWV